MILLVISSIYIFSNNILTCIQLDPLSPGQGSFSIEKTWTYSLCKLFGVSSYLTYTYIYICIYIYIYDNYHDCHIDYHFDLNTSSHLKGFPVDVLTEIYPSVLPGLNKNESIMDKRQLCIRAINAIESMVDATCTKTLRFEKHTTIEDMRCKLMVIYNPLRHFSSLYLPGYVISNSHETTLFSMNYQEYHQ